MRYEKQKEKKKGAALVAVSQMPKGKNRKGSIKGSMNHKNNKMCLFCRERERKKEISHLA